jgi:hypothetical protein
VPTLVVSALSTFDNKGLKKGKKEVSAFEKQVKNFGKVFAGVFGTAALLNYSKKAVQAFADDEKAAKSLAVQLENTGNAFRINEVETYIASLQSLYGVLDDQLRPAFQTLLNATGSVTLSQKALETALNVSAGTGKDLESVVAAIAKGAAGTTTALSRLGTGLDKATIASGDMNKIMAALDKKFAGQAAARLDTYAGKMDKLKVAAADATEIIGKGLIDALSALGKDNSIDQASNSMNNFAVAIANTARGMGELIGEIKNIVDSDVGKFLLGVAALATLGKKQLIVGAAGLIAYDIGKSQGSSALQNANNRESRLEIKALKETVFYRKEENKQLKAKTEVDKLQDKFDLERIGLTKALNETTDAETKLRLEAKIAILDNNEALAKKINAEMEAAKSVTDLSRAFGGATAALDANIAKLKMLSETVIAKINQRTAEGSYNPTGISAPGIQQLFSAPQGPLGNIDYTVPMGSGNPVYAPSVSGTPMSYADIRLTVDTAVAGDRFQEFIADAVAGAQRSGYSTTSAGSLNP